MKKWSRKITSRNKRKENNRKEKSCSFYKSLKGNKKRGREKGSYKGNNKKKEEREKYRKTKRDKDRKKQDSKK